MFLYKYLKDFHTEMRFQGGPKQEKRKKIHHMLQNVIEKERISFYIRKWS